LLSTTARPDDHSRQAVFILVREISCGLFGSFVSLLGQVVLSCTTDAEARTTRKEVAAVSSTLFLTVAASRARVVAADPCMCDYRLTSVRNRDGISAVPATVGFKQGRPPRGVPR
jgi:hypothetical protein